jgi:hypothetical protein
MKNEKTFEITVSGTDNCEWQGELRMPDGEKLRFRSVIELVRAINAQINAAEEEI